ncbi:MAG: RIP metalloprotease RseP [candidate division Zixibacteria bacterium]|nr:RIP metalloprotease RseP [candidate division Zixibacteria bacterium]
MLTALSFIFVLGVLIFIHELGHFLVAKKVGIKVEKFSLGFPPNIYTKQVGETTYCIGMIPLGGYVKMIGENPDEEITGADNEFMSKSILQRAAVIFAGPFMNYVLAILLLIGIAFFGGRPIFDTEKIVVGQVTEDGPAFKSGLQENDIIIDIDGTKVTDYDSLRVRINAKINEQLSLTWVRGLDTISTDIVTTTTPIPLEDGTLDSVGIIGFYEKVISYESFGLVESVKRGFYSAHIIVYETVRFVVKLVSGKISPDMIGGPIFIAKQSGKEAEKGAQSLFFFMALLSVNLAVLNVLPIPILDGGHLVFLTIEAIRGGNPLSMKARIWAQQVGMVVLLTLIIFVTYNDILRLFK